MSFSMRIHCCLVTRLSRYKSNMINAIASLPFTERSDIIYHARQLMNLRMHVQDSIMMILNVAAVPAV